MQIPIPKSHITNRQARPPVTVVPCVPDVRDVSDVRDVFDVFDVSLVRDVRDVFANARCPKKNRTPRNSEVGSRNAECGMPMRRPARQQGLIIQSDIPKLESGVKTAG